MKSEAYPRSSAGQLAAGPSLPRAIRRFLGRIYHEVGPIEDAIRDTLRAAALLAWVALVRLGLARKRILVMHCAGGGEIDGFYAQFTVVLGMLEHFEKWGDSYAGARVDFGDQGLYYEPAHGRNSWQYHFQPIEIVRNENAIASAIDLRQQYRLADRGEHMPRSTAAGLIARHIHVRPRLQEKVDAFVREQFGEYFVIGVHYRGTDKWTEAPRVPYEEVFAAVRAAISATGSGRYRLFVASDEQTFVDDMLESFPGRVLCWNTLRSSDGSPIDFRLGDNFTKGEDVVIDCLLLSRCHRLIRTSSSLSLCSGYFNPDIPVLLLNGRHPKSSDAAASNGA